MVMHFNDELTPSPKLFGPILIVRRACYSNHRRNLWLAETIPNTTNKHGQLYKKKRGEERKSFLGKKVSADEDISLDQKKNFKQKTIQLESRTAGHPLCIFKRFKKRSPLVSGPGACHLLVFFLLLLLLTLHISTHAHTRDAAVCALYCIELNLLAAYLKVIIMLKKKRKGNLLFSLYSLLSLLLFASPDRLWIG